MTVIIDLNPQEEAWLKAQTQDEGLSPAEVIKKLVNRHIPAQNRTDMELEPNNQISEMTEESNLIRVNGHILFKSVEIGDWAQAIADERESRLASLCDVD